MSQLLLSIGTLLTSAVVAYAVACWRLDSGSLRLKKQLSVLQSDITTLESALSSLRDTVLKVSRRTALTDYRQKQRDERGSDDFFGNSNHPPPPGDKEAAKRYYLRGKTHADVARMVQRGNLE